MKRCPKCNRQYSDATLSFCLQDGTPLVEVNQSSVDTVSFRQPVTAAKLFTTQELQAAPSAVNEPSRNYAAQPPPSYTAQSLPPVKRWKSRAGLIVALVTVPLLLVVTVSGVAGWWYLTREKRLSENKTALVAATEKQVTDGSPDSQPNETNIQTANTPNSDRPQPGAVDVEAVKKEVAEVVEAWKAATENRKSGEYAAMYGEKVEYFDEHGATPTEIKGKIQKIFDTYSEIDIEITNLVVAIDAEADAATALFDKEWSYEAGPKLSEGKAHAKLHLRKVGNQWKIIAEEYLKIYDTEN